MHQTITISLPSDLIARIEASRGGEPRSRFIAEALKKAMAEGASS